MDDTERKAIFGPRGQLLDFSRQVSAILDALERRLLPAFEGIQEEAEAVRDRAWNEFMEAPATGEEDGSVYAEVAEGIGLDHYHMLQGIRQGMLNLFAVAIFHAFEQQLDAFVRSEAARHEPPEAAKSLKAFRERLAARGVDVTRFSCWQKLEELRLLANTAKHGAGPSATALEKLRPELLENPQTTHMNFMLRRVRVPIVQPLVGEDLYVSLQDIRRYRDAIVDFWQEIGNALQGPLTSESRPISRYVE